MYIYTYVYKCMDIPLRQLIPSRGKIFQKSATQSFEIVILVDILLFRNRGKCSHAHRVFTLEKSRCSLLQSVAICCKPRVHKRPA